MLGILPVNKQHDLWNGLNLVGRYYLTVYVYVNLDTRKFWVSLCKLGEVGQELLAWPAPLSTELYQNVGVLVKNLL